jgi:PhnB protein
MTMARGQPTQQWRVAMSVSPIPQGYHNVTPQLVVDNARQAIDFYKQAFDANELMCFEDGGKVQHAEIQIGDSHVMLSDEFPDRKLRSPKSIGGTPASLMVYVSNVDKTFDRAISAGARAEQPVKDQFYGDRTGTLIDPYGHRWTVATHTEDVSEAELKTRMSRLH